MSGRTGFEPPSGDHADWFGTPESVGMAPAPPASPDESPLWSPDGSLDEAPPPLGSPSSPPLGLPSPAYPDDAPSDPPPTGPLTAMIPRILETPAPAGQLRRRAGAKRLRVDWPACKGHGVCHEIAPELVTLDEWGYPILINKPLRGARADHAKKAVAACPTLALRLVDES